MNLNKKIIHRHYKWQSGGDYFLAQEENQFLVFFENTEKYSVSKFKSLKKAREFMLEMIWDHPTFRGISFPRHSSRRVRELLK